MKKASDVTIDLLNFTIPMKIKALYAMQIIPFLFFSFNVLNAKKRMNGTWSLTKGNHTKFNYNVKGTLQSQQSIYAYRPELIRRKKEWNKILWKGDGTHRWATHRR